MKKMMFAAALLCTLLLTLTLSSPPAQAQSFSCTTVTGIPPAECQELVDLYNSTNGPNWKNKTGWLTTNTPCSWHGIGCSGGHVRSINLGDYQSSNQLVGSLPNFNGLLKLRSLNLANNQLSGSIPDFSNLPNLVYLNLDKNQLTGSIPNFSNLPKLESLFLRSNRLSGMIPDFDKLPKLKDLFLPNNDLSGTIPNFSHIQSLQNLDLSSNQLSGVIPEFNHLPNITWLYLNDNRLSGILPLLDWTRFDYLRLHNNCGLVALNTVQTVILISLGLDWQSENPDCDNMATPTSSNTPTPTPLPVTNQPPDTPQFTSSADGYQTTVGQSIPLEWAAAEDDGLPNNSLAYSLQIATDNSFADSAIVDGVGFYGSGSSGNGEDYFATIYNWTPQGVGTYYWRLYAFDGELGSEWSSPRQIVVTAALSQQQPGTWRSTSPMAFSRYDHASVRLQDGQVLVIGGYRTKAVELYNPTTETWRTVGSLSVNRWHPQAVLLPDGRVLAVGGGYSLDYAEIYDPTTETWTSTSNTASEPSYSHTATLLQNGKVLVVYENMAELYDPATDTWSLSGTLNAMRLNHTATLLR